MFMLIYKCGTEVITKSETINAIITAISIRFDRVTYEISYFRSGLYYSVFLNENEFELKTNLEKSKIGFK